MRFLMVAKGTIAEVKTILFYFKFVSTLSPLMWWQRTRKKVCHLAENLIQNLC